MQVLDAQKFRATAPNTPNLVLDGDGFYVSYNDRDTHVYGCDTTALVVGQMERFYILNGDHRTQYAALVGAGLHACLAYFEDHLHQANHRSDVIENKCDQPCLAGA